MVVASGGWVQNASFPAGQNINATQNNKMTAKGVLICRENSHPFQERTLTLEQPVKIGRSVARATAAPNNAIFDCKVLSRNHALLWYSSGKFYLQDTHSSNGTFINNQRLSAAGLESAPKEVHSGDIVQFGVDVMENARKFKHGCIVATLKLYLPDEKEASVNTSVPSTVNNVSLEDLYKLNQVMQEASRREKALQSKLGYLQQLVANTRIVANQSWQALIAEDRLLSWVETIESQLSVYSKNYTEDKIRNELVKLLEEKAQYQNAAKEELQKLLQEKLEISQRQVQLQERLNETEEECQSLHNIGKHTQTELQMLSRKYSDTQKKLQETTNKLNETEEKMKDMMQNVEQEKKELLKRLEDQSRIEKCLQAMLRNSRLDSVNIYKQITALRNYMQILQDMNKKKVTDDNLETKDEENPIEAINIILNKLNSIQANNMEIDMESSLCPLKDEQDNQINSQDIDTNQLNNSDISFTKEQLDDSLSNNDNVTEYILPPPSRKTLVNGNVNIDNTDINSESDTNSDATDDVCSITSDDTSEKSVIEIKREEPTYVVAEEMFVPYYKMEVRFACEENSNQLEASHQLEATLKKKESEERETEVESMNSSKCSNESVPIEANQHKKKDEGDKDSTELNAECDGEHLEGDYVKTLKPMSKSDAQQTLFTRDYLLQALISSLDSLKLEDNLESQQAVKMELETLKGWLINEPPEEVIEKLKKLYYRAKNESQRIQELHEELVILKEKYNTFVEEKAELSKKYTALRTQCVAAYNRNVLSMKKLKRKSDSARGGLVSKIAGALNASGDVSPTRVCRDFLRNVCHRGKRCKYLHERSEDDPIDEYTFCHDFQNGMCNWPGCKFLHCTENEEKRFRATGELPAHILTRLKNNNEKPEYPMCKDFIKGSCQRTNCKFRHWKNEEPQHNLIAVSHHSVSRPQHNFNGTSNGENRRYEEDRNFHWQMEDQHSLVTNNGYNASSHPPDYIGPPEPKRRIVSGETVVHFEASPLVGQHTAQPVTPGYYYPVIPRNEARAIVLEDENALLRKKIEELKKQVSDLTATNEFLLDQNAQLRMSGKRTANVTAVTVPAVTITNTVPPSQAPTPQQMVNAAVAAGTLRTVTASVATVPVSIATVAPVSIAAVSMAPVSIPPPIVTMAQQTITMSGSGPQATNQQPQNTQQPASLPLSISGATAPLVSYPIMTQELRPVLQ